MVNGIVTKTVHKTLPGRVGGRGGGGRRWWGAGVEGRRWWGSWVGVGVVEVRR